MEIQNFKNQYICHDILITSIDENIVKTFSNALNLKMLAKNEGLLFYQNLFIKCKFIDYNNLEKYYKSLDRVDILIITPDIPTYSLKYKKLIEPLLNARKINYLFYYRENSLELIDHNIRGWVVVKD